MKQQEDAIKGNWEDRTLLGGDFNGRIRERGTANWEEERGKEKNPKAR
jgi:hypothetical protein